MRPAGVRGLSVLLSALMTRKHVNICTQELLALLRLVSVPRACLVSPSVRGGVVSVLRCRPSARSSDRVGPSSLLTMINGSNYGENKANTQ